MAKENSTPISTTDGGNISLSGLCLTGAETFIGLQPVMLRASTDSLRRSQVGSELSLTGEDNLGLQPATPRTSIHSSFRTPEVYTNHAYDNYIACEDYLPENQYEDLASVIAKQNAPRKKANDMYESTSHSVAIRRKENELYETATAPPARKPRSRQVTECSTDSIGSYASYIGSPPRQSCVTHLVLFLVLIFSMAAFVLVILLMFGKVGMQCGCKGNQAGAVASRKGEQEGSTGQPTTGQPTTGQPTTGQPTYYKELEMKINALQQRMEARNEEYKQLQIKVIAIETLMNASANQPAEVPVANNTVETKTLIRAENELAQKMKKLSDLEQKVNLTQSQTSETKNAVHKLQEKHHNVLLTVKQLQRHLQNVSLLSSATANVQTNISQWIRLFVDGRMDKLSQNVSSLVAGFDKLNRTRTVPVKTADFLSCKHYRKDSIGQTGKKVDAFYEEKLGKKIVGATCSSNVETHSNLEYVPSQPAKYKCECKLPDSATSDKDGLYPKWKCSIFIWECSTS